MNLQVITDISMEKPQKPPTWKIDNSLTAVVIVLG